MAFVFPKRPPLGFTQAYIGTPWVWRGRDFDGFDCTGVLLHAWKHHFGYLAHDPLAAQKPGGDLSRARQAKTFIGSALQDFEEIPRPRLGAGVLMRAGRLPTHVGLYAGGGDILHCDEGLGETVTERASDLSARIIGYYWPKAAA